MICWRTLYWATELLPAAPMKHVVELPGPAIVNRAVHSMAVIVIILFASHFARLSGFSAAATAIAALVALAAACTFALRRSVSVDSDAQTITTTITGFSMPLRTRREHLPGMAWCGVRSDLPDLVVEVGNPEENAVEVLRFRNAYGSREKEVADACTRLAAALQIEDRGHAGAAISRPLHGKE